MVHKDKKQNLHPPQYPYFYPPPYPIQYPPVYFSPPESQTAKGLFLMFIAGIILTIGPFITGLLAIIGWIISSAGFFMIYGDRNSFPEPHPTNMKQSLIFYIFGIFFLILAAIFLSIAILSILFYSSETNIQMNIFGNNLIIAFSLGLLGSMLMFLARYKLLIELLPSNRKPFLQLTIVLILIFIVISMVLVHLVINDPNSMNPFLVIITIVGLAFISHILFLICFYSAHNYQKINPLSILEKYKPPPAQHLHYHYPNPYPYSYPYPYPPQKKV